MSSADFFPSSSRSHGMMYSTSPADLELLLLLTQAQSLSGVGLGSPLQSRRPAMDPLILETATASDPNITRHHYLHEFYPQEDHSCHHSDTSSVSDLSIHDDLGIDISRSASPLNLDQFETGPSSNSPSVHSPEFQGAIRSDITAETEFYSSVSSNSAISVLPPPLQVNCEARARIPTPHGEMFLHLYHNNRDGKEHLAIVVDHDQMDRVGDESQYIRSRSLDKVQDGETEMDRLVRGAYVGRLTTGVQVSSPVTSSTSSQSPLIRVHSECFTGETVGSQRCDCGEQLDSALSLISQEGKGVIVYLRQEGRGIGLLNKLKAYNLQDLGRDTVAANLELGFGEDERTYDIAAEILRDLGLGDGVKLLTNNPSKVQSLEVENIKVVERREMRPRAWTCQEGIVQTVEHIHRLDSGIGMIGGSATKSIELEKYLKTKVERMGHMLQLPESSKSLI